MGLFLTNGIVMANDLQNTTKEWRYYQGNQGQQRPLKDVTPPNTTQRALPPPSTTTPSPNIITQSSPSLAQKAWNGTKKIGKVASKSWTGFAGMTGIINNTATPSEDYYERFGMARYDDSRGSLGHFGVRALGYASDIGNALTGGTIGDLVFADKIRQKQEAEKVTQTQNAATPSQQEKAPDPIPQEVQTPISEVQNTATSNNTTPQPYISQVGFGLPNNNPNYQTLVEQINQMQQRTMADTQAYFGRPTRTPQRSWENEAQRKALLQEATTPIKGARGLTAAQMRLAHELSNDDIKMEQERHLQQNNLNHQLQQERLQQQGQNQRTLANEQGAMARAAMNEQGANQRFNIGHGLDVYKTMQGGQQAQAELGLRLAEFNQKSNNDQQDRMTQNEQMSLYQQFANAKDDSERDKILTQMAVLHGKSPIGDGGNYATMNAPDYYDERIQDFAKGGQMLYNTKTGEIVGANGRSFGVNGLTTQSQKSPEQMAELKKRLDGVSASEAKKIVLEAGYSPESVDTIIAELKGV